MVQRKLFILSLVIVLVCINWFKHALAQDLSTLSETDKALIINKMARPAPSEGKTELYQSPKIYDDRTDTLTRLPDSLSATKQSAGGQKQPTDPDALTSFEELLPFGMQLFAGPHETLPPEDIAAGDDYILGPGDNIIVSLWGQVEKEYSLTVDRQGCVFVPQAGEVVAWRRTLSGFREQLQRQLSSIYTNFEMSVALGKIRSIRIYLTGEVQRPGAYTVSSLTSLFNALYLAGGPTRNGSMRDIRVMRNGTKVAQADLYRFLLEGDNSSDARLESGDAIFVPMTGPRVAIRGKIKRPAIYELKGEASVLDLFALAGQPDADAYLDRIMMERVSSLDDWEVRDLDLSGPADSVDNVLLADGDRLTVFSIFEMKRNMVAAFGLVRHPGYYERDDSTRISDLITRAQLQPYDVHFKRANLFRRHSDWRREVLAVDLGKALIGSSEHDLLLENGDSLHVYSIRDVNWDRYIFIDGQVRNPGRYMYYDSMTVQDLIFLAGSFERGASLLRAEVARVDSLGEVTLESVDLGNPATGRIVLKEDDRVYVRQLPNWERHRTVKIEGEVMYPGEYVLAGREETLYELLMRAGGMTESAFPKGTVVERPDIVTSLEYKRIPQLLQKSNPVVQDSLGNFTRQMLFEYEPNSMNRIVLEVDRLLESRGACCDIILHPGDRIFVPRVPSGISVLGAVGSSGTIKFSDRENGKYYLKRAGSFTAQADKNGVRLIKANGEVYSGRGTTKRRVELGDVIVVPTKVQKDRDFTRTFTTTLSAITGVLTTILIVDRL